MSTLLIKNGRIVTATDDYVADVYVEGETIKAIGMNLPMQADKTFDATGQYVIPGGIDVHTHFDLPFGGTNSADDFETGTIAAAHGGTTTIVDFAVQSKGTSMQQAFETWQKKAYGKAAVDFGLHLILTEFTDQLAPDMDTMIKREGVTSFKMFTAYPGVFLADDATIFRAMKHTASNGGLICMHAENGGVIDLIVQRMIAEGKTTPNYHAISRPAAAEEEATHRVIALSELAGVPVYVVHVSSHLAMEQIREARDRGARRQAAGTVPEDGVIGLGGAPRPAPARGRRQGEEGEGRHPVHLPANQHHDGQAAQATFGAERGGTAGRRHQCRCAQTSGGGSGGHASVGNPGGDPEGGGEGDDLLP